MIMHDMDLHDKESEKLARHWIIDQRTCMHEIVRYEKLVKANNILSQIEALMLESDIGKEYINEILSDHTPKYMTVFSHAIVLMMDDLKILKELKKTPQERQIESDAKDKRIKELEEDLKFMHEKYDKIINDMKEYFDECD